MPIRRTGTVQVRELKALLLSLALILACPAAGALAQAPFPSRPIRILIPFAPGGALDINTRLVAQKISDHIGQPVVIEAKPGAGGAIAVNELMRAEPDGYTLLVTTSSHATLPALNKLRWHPSDDFTPIASIYSSMYIVMTNEQNASRFRTLPDLLAYVRANPHKLNWASSGIGGPIHLTGMEFAKIFGIDIVHVPFRGNNPGMQALLADDVQISFDTPTLTLPYIQDGKLVALAVTGERRLAKLPEVPTVNEVMKLDYSASFLAFALGPKGMPDSVRATLNREFVLALDDKTIQDRIAEFGIQWVDGRENTSENVKKHIDGFAATYGKLIAELGLRQE